MIKTPQLEMLAKSMAYQKPDFIDAFDRLNGGDLRDLVEKFSDQNRLIGTLAEICVRDVLEKTANKLGLELLLDPIKDEIWTDKLLRSYKFSFDGLGLHIYDDEVELFEYDTVAVVFGLPVVFEVKMVKSLNKRNINSRKRIKLEKIERNLGIISEYFNKDAGFCLVLPREQVREMYKPSDRRLKILQNN